MNEPMKMPLKTLWFSALSTLGLATITATIPHKTLATTQAVTTQPVTLYATTPQARTGQSVTLMAATNTPLSSGESLAIMNVTTGKILSRVTTGTTVNTVVLHHAPQTNKYVAVLTKDSRPIAVSWVARAIGNNTGYQNAAGQSISLTAPATAIPNAQFTVSAQPTGFKHPVYQFWWAMQGGQWHSSGLFSSASEFAIKPPRTGFLSVVAYARESAAPHNENADQQAIYEAKSETLVIGVGEASHTSPTSINSNAFVALSLANEVAVAQTILLTAQATGIVNPLYQFWFKSPTNGWQSSGLYTSNNTFSIPATVPGSWHVIAYARPLTAPPNETVKERTALEVGSPESTVTVHN